MGTRELHLSGRTQTAMLEDAVRHGLHGRLIVLSWPPLRDGDAWARLRALRSDVPATFVARLFPDGLQTTKAYDEYVERYFRFVDNAVAYDESQTIHGLSSTSRTCKHCSSHVAVEHVRGETCPVCGHDLRSNTTAKTIARWRERIAKVCAQAEAEAEKAGWMGSWGAVGVDDAEGDDGSRQAASTALLRSYDSEQVELAAGPDEVALYVPRQLADALASRARGAGLSMSSYLQSLVG